jgi:hypothetical protein
MCAGRREHDRYAALAARTCRATTHEVRDQTHDCEDQQDVDRGGGYVEHGETEDPREAEEDGKCDQHVCR